MTSLHPIYSHDPIGSLESLSKALGVTVEDLVRAANNQHLCIHPNTPQIKPNGKIRETFTFVDPLDDIHKRILATLLKKVVYPPYLSGSLKGTDYIADARAHSHAASVIKEDVVDFFPSTSQEVVRSIWKGLFNFPDDVADILTRLTTYDGAIPQGARTSPYLANLALWRREPAVVMALQSYGFVYTRYVDDIIVSSRHKMTNAQKTLVIRAIFGLLKFHGLRPSRRKHDIMSHGRKPNEKGPKGQPLSRGLYVHGLKVQHGRVIYSKDRRRNLRAECHSLIRSIELGNLAGPQALQAIDSIKGKALALSKLHSKDADAILNAIEPIRLQLEHTRSEIKRRQPKSAIRARVAKRLQTQGRSEPT